MKRIFALLVAFLLVFSLLPLYSLADDEATETSEPLETVVADTPTPSAPTETTPEPTITPAPASESPTPEALFLHFLDCDRTDSSGSGYLEVPCLPGDILSLEVKSESNGYLTYRWQILDAESTEEDPYVDIDPQEETTADEKALAITAEDAIIGVENYYRCVVTATSADATLEQYCYFTLVNDEPIQTQSILQIDAFVDLGDASQINVPADTKLEDIAFPSTLQATIAGSNAEVPVTWERSDSTTAWENGGTYAFNLIISDGYTLAEGVIAPTVTVIVGQTDSVSISIDPMYANPGDIVTLKATITGYEGASLQWQWAAIPAEEVQQALDARASSADENEQQSEIPQPVEGKAADALTWNDEAGATGAQYQFTAKAENLNRYWRLKITFDSGLNTLEIMGVTAEENEVGSSTFSLTIASLMIPKSTLPIAYVTCDNPYVVLGQNSSWTVTVEGNGENYEYLYSLWYMTNIIIDKPEILGGVEPFWSGVIKNYPSPTKNRTVTFQIPNYSGSYCVEVKIINTLNRNEEFIIRSAGYSATNIENINSESSLIGKVKSIVALCRRDVGSNEISRALYLHDWLVKYTEPVTGYSSNNWLPEGVLLYGRGVCRSYASAYSLLLSEIGITNICVYGIGYRGESSGSHAWNLVKLNGQWYHVDCFWDFSNRDKDQYKYFGLSDIVMGGDHSWDDNSSKARYPKCPSNLAEQMFSTPTTLSNPNDKISILADQSILFQWSNSYADSYDLIFYSPNGTKIIMQDRHSNSYTLPITVQTDIGTWGWQVESFIQGKPIGFSEKRTFVVLREAPIIAPKLHTPVTGSYPANTDITFSWQDAGASLYRLEIYQNSSNKITYNVTGTSKLVRISTPGEWTWRVCSMQNPTTVLATSYEKTFTITPAPSGGSGTYPIPTLQSPDDAKGFDVGSNITFQWNNTGATKYKIEFICDSTPSRTYFIDNYSGTSITRSFSAADNWRWQVRSYNGSDYGDAPHTRSFSVNNLPPTVNRNIQASYYEGVELSVLRYQTNISSIDFNCGTGMPSGVPFYSDAFSARFKYLSDNYTEGFYKFHYEVDDAIKIWIDGDCKVDQWSSHVLNEYSSPIFILGGTHNMWIDYADMGGEAKLKVEYASCPEPKISLASPKNGAVYTTESSSIPFEWSRLNLPGGSRYILEILNDKNEIITEGLVYSNQPCQKNISLPVGNYHWRVFMRASSGSTKQYCSSDYGYFSVTTPPPKVPDLEPIAITSSYIDGYLYFDSGIKNNTGITSNGFNVKWYVNGVLKAYAGHNGIAGNTTAYDGNNGFYFKPSASGTYNITYSIDVDNQIVESNESNNTATTQATIQIPAPLSISSVIADQSSANAWDTVTWTVGTTGGVGVKQYYYKLYCGTTLVNTPVWTTQTTFKSTLIDKGSYTLKVSVKDNTTTLTKTSAITTVTVPLSLVSVSTSAAVVGTGTRITWTANATGGVGTKQYCYLIYKDGSLFKQTAWSTTSSYSYTPTSVGSYYAEAWVSDSIDLYYKDSVPTKAVYPFAISAIEYSDDSSGYVTAGNASSPYVLTGTELTWTVTTSGGDGDIIYYYQLYNGTTLINTPEWTMQPTFTYMPTKAGTYTLKVTAKENTATVSKTSAATKVIVPLSIASITPTSTISTTGKTLSWSMKATGGAGTKYYRYVVYRDGTMIKQSSWTTSSVCSYMPTVVGVYSVNATVKDLSNSLSQDSVSTKIVLPFVIQSISCSSSYSTTGTQLTWSVTTAGGDGSIQYYYKLYKGTTLLNTPSWGTSSVFSYTPTTAGSYALRVYAKENTGTPSKASATTKVIVPLSITSMIPTSTLVTTGTSVTWAVKTAGGDGTKQYYYELYRESELIKTKSWGSLSSFAFTPTGTGTYTLKVSVKDISGSVTNEAAAVKVVLPITISGIMPSANLVARGQQITWTVSASGGDGAKQYYYKLYSGITLVNTVMWTSANSYSYTPTKAGSYTLKVYVKDNTPTVSKMSVAVKVA